MKNIGLLERFAFSCCLLSLALLCLGTKACQTDYDFASGASVPTTTPEVTGSVSATPTDEPLIDEDTPTNTPTVTATSTRTRTPTTGSPAVLYGVKASLPTPIPAPALILENLGQLGDQQQAAKGNKKKKSALGTPRAGQKSTGAGLPSENWLGQMGKDQEELDPAADQPGNVWEETGEDEEENDSEIVPASKATAPHEN